MALSRWQKAHGKVEPTPIVPKVEPAPEPVSDDEATEFDLGGTEERSPEQIEMDEYLDEMRARNPRAFEFGRIVGEIMKGKDQS